ncbi:MAG: thermonuclease family protein, partial [Bacteroidota bacterium]
LFKVKYVESVKTIVLENDLRVNLIGIDPYPSNWKILGEDVNYEGIKFLEEKFRNCKIYLKFDQEKYDEDGNLYSYVYLENKTFINAHILKNGFAQVDTKNKYAHFNKFSKIVQERDMVIKEQLRKHNLAY